MRTILISLLLSSQFATAKIDSLKINNKLVIELDTIQFDLHTASLSIDFNNDVPSRIKITPLQANFELVKNQSISYFNLEGGDYQLLIEENRHGSWILIKTITIVISRKFWQKAWFKWSLIIYLLFLIGIGIYLFFLYDFRQKLKMQFVRNQIASDLHDEVGSNLNSIGIFVELLKKKMPNAQPELMALMGKITDNSEETVSLMRDTVWAINPENDNTERLFEKMESIGLEVLSLKGVIFSFENKLNPKKSSFSMKDRRNIYMIYKEAINNIAKHAEATKAQVKIYYENGVNCIEILDNGKGFEVEKTFEGNGLKNFKFRSEDEDIMVNVSSTLGTGTQVIVKIFEA